MEKFETNSFLIINYFKKNYIKMFGFIIISLIISLSLTYMHTKNSKLFYSKFQVIFNRAMPFNQPINLKSPHYDFIYFMEKKGIKNIRLLQSKHASTIVQFEINHKDLNDKGLKQYNEYLDFLKEYKKKLLLIIDENIKMYIVNSTERINETDQKNLYSEHEEEILNFVSNAEEVKRLIKANDLFYFTYDSVIHSRKLNNLFTKNAVITICVNILIILFILWFKIIIREIKKNS